MAKTSRERVAEQFRAAADKAAQALRTNAVGSHDRELGLIIGLCRELGKLGLNVGLSDARPAAVVRQSRSSGTSPGDACATMRTSEAPGLWITVDESAEFFEWADAEHRHPVDDPPGAAAVISEHAKARRSGPGEAS
jgi:hypothetical protein